MLVSNVAISVPLPGMSFRYSGRSAATGGRTSSCEGGGAIAAGGPGALLPRLGRRLRRLVRRRLVGRGRGVVVAGLALVLAADREGQQQRGAEGVPRR